MNIDCRWQFGEAMRKIGICVLLGLVASFVTGSEKDVRKESVEPVKTEKVIFAGGCFWCIESAFTATPGVKKAVSGYTGGSKANPSYKEVCSGTTGHYEAVEVTFDPSKISFLETLNKFWQQIDPTDEGGQFADRGPQYGTAVFYFSDRQKTIIEASKKAIDESLMFSKPVVTKVLKAAPFYPAEEYHQKYSKKNPLHYNLYKAASGRSKYLEDKWSRKTCPVPNNINTK